MKKNIQGVLFDFNGTMVFDSPEHKKAWNVFSLKYRDKPICDEELDHMHGRTNKNIIAMLLDKTLSEQESEQLSRDKEALYREICRSEGNEYHMVAGLENVLNELKKRNVPMTICSASIKENIDFFIDVFQLTRWFDPNKIVYDDGTHTDKISMFKKGADILHVPVEQCLIIEDSLSGIHFANEVNAAKIIAITTPDKEDEYKLLAGVDKIIYDYCDFDMSYFDNFM